MSNGIVKVTLTVPDGMVTSVTYKGSDNLLESRNKEDNRGYEHTHIHTFVLFYLSRIYESFQ